MIQDLRRPRIDAGRRPKWFNSPVTTYEGDIASIRQFIPSFERRSFALAQPDDFKTPINMRLDTIVRLPIGDDAYFVPIGIVSKDYVLVPHLEVLDAASQALNKSKIPPKDVRAELTLTEYGERMELSLYLPWEYSFDPGDGNPLAMRLECFNSVDGSTRFRALMGWFRFVCSNGLVVGITQSDLRRRHVGELRTSDIGAVLSAGLVSARREKENFQQWMTKKLEWTALAPWIEDELKHAWGFKAATRTLHIAKTGHDVEIAGPYKGEKPTTIRVRKGKRVPGSPPTCRNLYDLSQVLAWLAKERRDLQEQLEWREKIPDLMKGLLNKARV